MKKFQKIIIFSCLLSFIFSMVITDIEPKTVTVGEKVNFVLTVQNYNSLIEDFSLADKSFTCSTYDPETNLLKQLKYN